MTKRVNAYQTTAALVRAFFEAFAKGVIDSQKSANTSEDKYTAKEIKQLMLDHYEEVSGMFFDVMFPTLVKLNYPDVRLAQEKLTKEMQGKQPTMFDYLKFACKSQKLYDALVEEYKRNFTLLLQGKLSSISEHVEAYQHGVQLSVIDEPHALNLLVRVILMTYGKCLKGAKPNQVSVYKMLLVNIQLLINDVPFHDEQADLQELFAVACGKKEENLNVVFNTLNDMMKNLMQD